MALGPSPIDTRVRLVSIALEPALALARRFALPLDDLQELVSVGYFRETRSDGMSLRRVARRFQKSLRTIATLSKKASGRAELLRGSERLTYRRRMLELAAAKPRSSEKLLDTFSGVDLEELNAELSQLLEEGLLSASDGKLQVSSAYVVLTSDEIEQRLDSLRQFLQAITQLIQARFLSAEPPPAAFARVLTFNATRPTISGLGEAAFKELRRSVVEADEASSPDDPQVSLTFSLVELPSAP